jgi:hypothetical protein
MRRVIETLAAILEDGRRQGLFRPAHPFLTQLAMIGPLLLWAAAGPVRERFARQAPVAATAVSPTAVIDHVYAMALGTLLVQKAAPPARAKRRSRT